MNQLIKEEEEEEKNKMVDEKAKRLLVSFFILRPILFLIDVIDHLFGMILPNKYDDKTLPDRNSKLSVQVKDGTTDSLNSDHVDETRKLIEKSCLDIKITTFDQLEDIGLSIRV